MNENVNCNEDNCKPAILVENLDKRVSGLEVRIDKIDQKIEKTEDKLDSNAKETSETLAQLRENYSESKAISRITLENIGELKLLIKTNNDSNIQSILSMVKDNTSALIKNNETNLQANKNNAEFKKDIEAKEKIEAESNKDKEDL